MTRSASYDLAKANAQSEYMRRSIDKIKKFDKRHSVRQEAATLARKKQIDKKNSIIGSRVNAVTRRHKLPAWASRTIKNMLFIKPPTKAGKLKRTKKYKRKTTTN